MGNARTILAVGVLVLAFGGAAGEAGKDAFPVFPDEDRDADPSVPAEQGGKGFGRIAASLGWRTSVSFDLIGDPRAKKGGELVSAIANYPTSFRPHGPYCNFNYVDFAFEPLFQRHPNTFELIPCLATHWKESEDGLRFSIRLNPNAKWADGSPVTSEDVLATFDLLADDTLLTPWATGWVKRFDRPQAQSKYIVTVEARERSPRNDTILLLQILPARELRPYRTAGEWIEATKLPHIVMGSGPYEALLADQVEGRSMTLRRRPGYWAADARANVGLHNFDRLTWLVTGNDEAITYERFKKGELTSLAVDDHRRWAVEATAKGSELIRRGLVCRVEIYKERFFQFYGIALNMKRAPLDALGVRQALALLLDRKTIIRNLMHGQCVPLYSYWQREPFANPANPRNDFDPQAALKLLGEAGWKRDVKTGFLVDARGEPLQLKVSYTDPAEEKFLTVYQEGLRQAGITLTLDFRGDAEMYDAAREGRFQMYCTRMGALPWPSPWLFRSRDPGVSQSDNYSGLSDHRIDTLIDAYQRLRIGDYEERGPILREIDHLAANQYPYILLWDAPTTRLIHWNCLERPEFGFTKSGLVHHEIQRLWWHDPEKARALEAAKKDPSVVLPTGPTYLRHWSKERD